MYAQIIGVKRGPILRAELRCRLAQVFGKGRTAADVRNSIKRLSDEDARAYLLKVRQEWEAGIGG